MTLKTLGMGAAKIFGAGVKKTPKTRSDFKLKNTLKKIQKMPDKNFKSSNPATEKGTTRHGVVYEKRKNTPVNGSLGKKTYKSDITKYHQAHKRMGLIKD
jgi:hypothetical protein